MRDANMHLGTGRTVLHLGDYLACVCSIMLSNVSAAAGPPEQATARKAEYPLTSHPPLLRLPPNPNSAALIPFSAARCGTSQNCDSTLSFTMPAVLSPKSESESRYASNLCQRASSDCQGINHGGRLSAHVSGLSPAAAASASWDMPARSLASRRDGAGAERQHVDGDARTGGPQRQRAQRTGVDLGQLRAP
jgi:hypothetical protein